MSCLWYDCPTSGRGLREYQDPEEWEFHIQRAHLLHIQYACSIQGTFPSKPELSIGCGAKFATNELLNEHYSDFHSGKGNSPRRSIGRKRKMVDEDITPIIGVMPPEIAKNNRAVYEGPSRSLSIGQSAKRWRRD